MIRLLARKGISILITDHNAREIFSIVDRSYLIRMDEYYFLVLSTSFLENEEARQTYLGSEFKL